MKTSCKNTITYIALLILGTSIPVTSYATRWPVFVAPEKEFLLQHHYIDTQSCPEGEGLVVPQRAINILQFLCKSFCPGNWDWKAESDGECHQLATDFALQSFDIVNYDDENGTSSYSDITAYYGKKDSHTAYFSFTLSTIVGDYWQCFEMNSELHLLSCTNDI